MNIELHSKILKISELCMSVNRPAGPTIFTDYAGHVDCFTVQIFVGGWEEKNLPDENYRIWINGGGINILETDECLKYLEFLEARQKKVEYKEKSPCGNTD